MVILLEIRSLVNAKALCWEALQSKWKITDWQIADDNPLGIEAVVWLTSKNGTCHWCEPDNRAEQLVHSVLFQQARSLGQVNWKLWAKHRAGKTQKGLTGLLWGWLADIKPAAWEQGCISGIRSFKPTLRLRGVAGGDWGMVGKEVRWLQAEQVPPRPLATNGCNGCFVSRTWYLGRAEGCMAELPDEWGLASLKVGMEIWTLWAKEGNLSSPVWIQNTANRIVVHQIFLTNLVFTAISYVFIFAFSYVINYL